jgi:hypothetical protein
VPAVELEIYDLYGMERVVAYREIEYRRCVLPLSEGSLFIEHILFFPNRVVYSQEPKSFEKNYYQNLPDA